jgi:polysaccharide biosynthesis protein PelF
MKVALTAEGTYPHHFGGVSVWCDQLIRGLPRHEFQLIPLVATGAEPVRWELPANVSAVAAIPMWGPPPPLPMRARLRRDRVPLPVRELLDVLLTPRAQGQDRFAGALRELSGYAQTRNLRAVLASEESVGLLAAAWRERQPGSAAGQGRPDGAVPARGAPTLDDAVTGMQLIEHALRPLSYPPARADVVHAVTNGLGALPALAAKWRYGTPMLVTEHGVYLREQYMHLRRPAFGWPVKDLYLRFLWRLCALGYREAEVITPGNVYNRRWEEELGADASRIRTVYNGVNPDAFPALHGEPAVPTISWVGRIDPVKDVETLLRAFSLVLREMPEARLRIFGSPPQGREAYLDRCRMLAADLGIGGQAVFEGRVPEIRDAYQAGHVVVLCSITEGFPYTLIEAMACGRPCVATDVGGVSEALGEDAGLVVPPRNPAALAAACLRLLRNAGLRKTLGAAARRRALEHFTVDRAISAFDEMYSLLGAGCTTIPAVLGGASSAASVLTRVAARADDAIRAEAEAAERQGPFIGLPPGEATTVIMPQLDEGLAAPPGGAPTEPLRRVPG